jgi:hypothetical protein
VILSTGTRTDRHFGWTDTGFFFGANMREAIQDYEDALEDLPEVFLGLNWRLYSIQETIRVLGTRPSRIVMTQRAMSVATDRDFATVSGTVWASSLTKFIVIRRNWDWCDRFSFHAGDIPEGAHYGR